MGILEHYLTVIAIAVQTAVYLLGGYALYVRNDTKQHLHMEALRMEVNGMKVELAKLTDVITVQAVQTNRLDNLTAQITQIDRRVEDLRRGNGFVRGRTALDGEYSDS